MDAARDASTAIVWPPVIFAAAMLSAGALTWWLPWHLPPAHGFMTIAGGLVISAALTLFIGAGREFSRAATAILPNQPTSAIVAAGVYRVSRNPMYLGQVLFLLGLALLTGSAWFLIAAPFAMLAYRQLAILREEAYLERKFGLVYLAYKARVRRWL